MHRFTRTIAGAFALGLSLIYSQSLLAQVRALAKPGDMVNGLGPILNITDGATFSKSKKAYFVADVLVSGQSKQVLVRLETDGTLSPVVTSNETLISSDLNLAPAGARILLSGMVNGVCGYQGDPAPTRRVSANGDLLMLANITGTGITQPVCNGTRLINAGNATSLIWISADGSQKKLLSRLGAIHPENPASTIQRPYLKSPYGVIDNTFVGDRSEAIVHILGTTVNNQAVGGAMFMSAQGQLTPWMRDGSPIANLADWTIHGGSATIHSSTTDNGEYPMTRFDAAGNYIVRKVTAKRNGSSTKMNAIVRIRTDNPHQALLVLKYGDFIRTNYIQLPGTYSYDTAASSMNYYYGNPGRFAVSATGTVFIGLLRARESNGTFAYSTVRMGALNPDHTGAFYGNANGSFSIVNGEDVLASVSITDEQQNVYPAVLKWTAADSVSILFNGMTDSLPGVDGVAYRLTPELLQQYRWRGISPLQPLITNSEGNYVLRMPYQETGLGIWASINGQRHLVLATGMSIESHSEGLVEFRYLQGVFGLNDQNQVISNFTLGSNQHLGVWSANSGLRIVYSEVDQLESGEEISNAISPPPYGYAGTSLGLDNQCISNNVGILGMALLSQSNARIVVEVNASEVAAPVCAADFNQDGSLSMQDMFDYLAAYSARDISADTNHNDSVTVQDLFDFLRSYQLGC